MLGHFQVLLGLLTALVAAQNTSIDLPGLYARETMLSIHFSDPLYATEDNSCTQPTDSPNLWWISLYNRPLTNICLNIQALIQNSSFTSPGNSLENLRITDGLNFSTFGRQDTDPEGNYTRMRYIPTKREVPDRAPQQHQGDIWFEAFNSEDCVPSLSNARDFESWSCAVGTRDFCWRDGWQVKSILLRPRMEGDSNGTCTEREAWGSAAAKVDLSWIASLLAMSLAVMFGL